MSCMGSSDDFFFCVTASSPISVADFLFTYFCNPPVYPSSVVPCHSAPLRAVHLTRLPLLDVNSRRLFDTGYHRFHSPCDSHLNRRVLAATSLVWPVTLALYIVHLGNVIRRTRLLHSTLLLITEASSNQPLLFADWVVLRTLIAHSRRSPWSCILPRSPKAAGQQTEHLAQRLGLVLDLPALWSTALSDSFTSCCPRPRGLVLSTRLCLPALHGPESSWDCRRVLHKTPPNELDRHDPSGRGLHSSRCTRRNCEVLHIVQQRFSEASTGSAETNSNVFSQTMYVVSLLRNCFFLYPTRQFHSCGSCSHAANKPQNCNQLSHTSDMADVPPSSNNRACPLHHIGTCRCITTSTSTTQSKTALVEPPLSSELSGWSVLSVASPLALRRFGR